MAYIRVPIETDWRLLAERALDHLAGQIPGWEPSPGDPVTIAIETFSRIAAEIGVLATDTPEAIMRWFGASLLGLPPHDATRASVDSTWVLSDTAGHTIPAGTLVGIPDPSGALVAFETVAAVTVSPGDTDTATGGVALIARDAGAEGSGLTGAPVLLDALAYVGSLTLTGTTSGGQDAEPDADYLGRLVRELRLLAPRPILAEDFATLALRIAGVERAVAIDGYDSDLLAHGQERTVAVAVVDAAGEPLSSGVKAAVRELLEAEREPNFRVFVLDPTYTTVNVSVSLVTHPGFDAVGVQAAVVAALAQHLSPARWGLPGVGDPETAWRNRTVVRHLEVAAEIDRVAGVDYLTALLIQGLAENLEMPGPVPLPRPGAITVTATSP